MKTFMPDLILLDITLPGMDGWNVLDIIKNNTKMSQIPVVMCTAENNMSSIEKADQYGIKGYITKPIRIERVLTKVKAALNK